MIGAATVYTLMRTEYRQPDRVLVLTCDSSIDLNEPASQVPPNSRIAAAPNCDDPFA